MIINSYCVYSDDIETYNTSRPIIQVSYNEYPVTVTDFSLKDSLNGVWYIESITDLEDRTVFNFTVNFLPKNTYTFFVTAEDVDDNVVEANKTFKTEFPGMPLWLRDPLVGIGNTEIYNITVESKYNATCRYGIMNPSACQSYECRFEELSDTFQITSNRTMHRIVNYDSTDIPTLMYVICRLDVATGSVNYSEDVNYGEISFYVGYDINPPTITSITASQNPVKDWNNKKTVLTAITDKESVCNLIERNPQFLPGINSLFNNENRTEYMSYKKNHEINLSYNFIYTTEKFDFNYIVLCYNRAQNWSTQNYTVVVHLNKSITITQITKPVVNTDNIVYEIATNIDTVNCTVKLNDDNATSMTQNNPRNYTKSLNLELGQNDVDVLCWAGDSATANFNILADNTKPSFNIIANSQSCGLEELNFELNGSDKESKIREYYYKVEDSKDLLRNWSRVSGSNIIRYRYDLTEDEKYKITAYAVNRANLSSDPDDIEITASKANSSSCDFTSPKINITVTGNDYKADIKVACEDKGSGCTDSFDYVLVKKNESCIGYQSYSYNQLPISITEEKKFCAVVYDLNKNNASATRVVSLIKAECGNSIIEENERCDKNSFNGVTCRSFGFQGGILQCTNDCSDWNTDNCAFNDSGYCGDGKINNFFNEQCDGNSWGKITRAKGCSMFGFASGTLICNPPSIGKGSRCMFNTSACVAKIPNNLPSCQGNSGGQTTTLDKGEQCELTKPFSLNCTDFDSFSSGELICGSNCVFNIENCASPTPIVAVPEPVCGNSVVESGEKCDGSIANMKKEDFTILLGCDDIECNQCNVQCAEIIKEDTCDNVVKDGDETDLDCGGSCSACVDGKKCISGSDCESDLCQSGICVENSCLNNEKDGDETDLDCGGPCDPCDDGKECIIDDDCASGSCVEGICIESISPPEEEELNPLGLILLIIGIVLVLGGGGYIAYNTYYKKPAKEEPLMMMPEPEFTKQSPENIAIQRKKFEDRKQKNIEERKSLLKGFETDDEDTELKKIDYVDMKKVKESTDKDQKENSKTSKESPKESSKEQESSKESDKKEDAFSKLKGMAKDVKIEHKRGKGSGDNFKKLESLSKTADNISDLSGKSEESIAKIMDDNKPDNEEVSALFENLDRSKILSKDFKQSLSDLIDNGKMKKDNAKKLLFDYLDQGLLTRSEVAKILSELKII